MYNFKASRFLNFVMLCIILPSIFFMCKNKDKDVVEIEQYKGPMRVMEDITILHSDSGIVTAKIEAEKVLEFASADQEFPEGVYIEFYDGHGNLSSFLKANYAYFTSEKSLWKGTGNVILRNIKNEEQLNSEELLWEPNSGKVYTDKFVNIESGEEILTGTGLETTQDFTSYTILKPEGIFTIEE
jgi:LPS export ABC transporter protein LptC